MNKVRINRGRAFMWHIRFGGIIIVFLLMAVIFAKVPQSGAIPLAMAVSMIVPFLWSSFEILEIDLEKKIISEHLNIMGKRFQESITQFSGIEKVYINQVRMAQNMHSISGKLNTVQNVEYHAYLKTLEGKKFFLVSREDPDNLLEKLEMVNKKLKTTIIKNYEDQA